MDDFPQEISAIGVDVAHCARTVIHDQAAAEVVDVADLANGVAHVVGVITEAEASGKPVPQALLDIAEAGGVIPVLQAEGLLEAAENA